MRLEQCKECRDRRYTYKTCQEVRKSHVQCPCYDCIVKSMCIKMCLPKTNLNIHMLHLYNRTGHQELMKILIRNKNKLMMEMGYEQ